MAIPKTQETLDAIKAGVQASNWRLAVDDLVKTLTNQGEPYSSGEIAAFLREEAPTLKFAVTRIGEHVRDAFWAGTLPEFDDGMGGTEPPVQVEQRTSGSGRTPAGQPVFIYGPDQSACLAHDFEVDIPLPPGVKPRPQVAATPPAPAIGGPTAYTKPAAAPGPTTYTKPAAPAPATPATSPGQPIQAVNQGSGGLVAKIISDKRMLVPRSAFEAYLFESGKAMRAGDSVFVSVETDCAFISLDQDPNAKMLTIQAVRGRLLFANPNTPFVPGTAYTIRIDKKGLHIDL